MSTFAESVRAQFPILDQQVHGKPLVYLDNAATTHRPLVVRQAMDNFYAETNSNVHRGVHCLSQRATEQFEASRDTVAKFINARESAEIIWTKGCTEAINLVAATWGRANLQAGDQVLCSNLEHHANLVPWQMIAAEKGAKVVPIPISDDCEILLDELEKLLQTPTKIVCVKHVCNATGTVNPIEEITRLAHLHGAKVMVDGAQALAHVPVDVQSSMVDFYAMSAHKVYGPMGMGALYGRREHLEAMPPYQGGGDMIRTVSFEGTTFNEIPNKFEAGTPYVPGAIGFAAALDWLNSMDMAGMWFEEAELLDYATQMLEDLPGFRIIGKAKKKTAILSFVHESIHPHDMGTILDRAGVAVRTGHHCCMPLMKRMGVPATSRASLAVYNTNQDIKVLIDGLKEAVALFQ
ncbi:MAG: SufS family cysteine desulfurase [Armatimonadetes bacterium]|nr:SufS family cysteine desulfurase [Armatimonadota bacterium]